MTGEAAAVAHPNIALSKYWGKRPSPGNFPAVPSLSVTLAGLSTRTRVRFDAALPDDRLTLNGRPGSPVGSSRVDLQACKLEYSIVSPK